MSLLDEFKVYCRDKGKYNLSDFSEILKMFSEFEADRKAKKQSDYDEEYASESSENVRVSEDECEVCFSNLFAGLRN